MTDVKTRRFIDKQDKTTAHRQLLMSLFVQTYNHQIHKLLGAMPYEAETNPTVMLKLEKMAEFMRK